MPLRGAVAQPRSHAGAYPGWAGAPRPDLLPGMGRPGLGAAYRVAQLAPAAGVSMTLLPADQPQLPGVGRPLEPELRRVAEALFHRDLGDVRIHEGLAARALGARAFTLGNTVCLAPGLLAAASTPEGAEVLGHELAHVVQQRSGRITPPRVWGVVLVQDPALEAEAKRLGLQFADTIRQVRGPAQPAQARAERSSSMPMAWANRAAGLRGGAALQRAAEALPEPERDKDAILRRGAEFSKRALALLDEIEKAIPADMVRAERDKNVATAVLLDEAGTPILPEIVAVSGGTADSAPSASSSSTDSNLRDLVSTKAPIQGYTLIDPSYRGRFRGLAVEFWKIVCPDNSLPCSSGYHHLGAGLEHIRHQDSEVQILDYFDQIEESRSQRTLLIFTDRTPCVSCFVMLKEFLARHPSVGMFVAYRRRYNFIADSGGFTFNDACPAPYRYWPPESTQSQSLSAAAAYWNGRIANAQQAARAEIEKKQKAATEAEKLRLEQSSSGKKAAKEFQEGLETKRGAEEAALKEAAAFLKKLKDDKAFRGNELQKIFNRCYEQWDKPVQSAWSSLLKDTPFMVTLVGKDCGQIANMLRNKANPPAKSAAKPAAKPGGKSGGKAKK